MRLVSLALTLAAGASVIACGAILGLQEPTVDDTIGDGSSGDGSGGDVVKPDAPPGDAPIDSTCGADLQNDTHNCGNCGHDCLGGNCSAGACQPVLVASSTSLAPYSMVMSGNDLYFTNVRAFALYTVYKVDKTLTNGNATQLVDYNQGYTTPVVSGLPMSVAVQGNYFYVSLYANSGSNGKWEGGIDRCPLTGCTTKTLAYYGINSNAVVANGTIAFFGATDISDVYTVRNAPLDLSTQPTFASPASEVNGMAVDGTDLFYGTADGVFSCTPTCNAAAITQGQTVDAELLAVDTNNVYFTSTPFQGTPTVQSVARGGGGPKLISGVAALPFGVATDGTNVYFTDVGDTANTATGSLMRCPVAGCSGNNEVTLSTGAAVGDNPRPVVVDSTAIYWGTRGGKIWRLAK